MSIFVFYYSFDKARDKGTLINIGSGKDYTIKWYANFIMKQMGVKLKIKFDKTKPDGMPRKLMDISLAKKYGWTAKTSLSEGFDKTIEDFKKNYLNLK